MRTSHNSARTTERRAAGTAVISDSNDAVKLNEGDEMTAQKRNQAIEIKNNNLIYARRRVEINEKSIPHRKDFRLTTGETHSRRVPVHKRQCQRRAAPKYQ